ncbi:TRAP transporter large permease [Vreelandella gomseomensis]|uniref:TRAP transporter large permease protein n=1 Tax=Vreelandella gomseomensis TaxID=370766 RepID=A0ABU1GAY9_9GAMM|nr:TRAP transporter large permease [Halomonas gomseomensis]MDR5874623.1 TRAP transporter large permease [Halomonas gomseomensis]
MMLFSLLLCATIFLLLSGIPVAYAFGMGALAFIWMSGRPLDYMLAQAFWQVGSFALLALPLFVLAGQLMKASSVAERLLAFIEAAVGRLRGGLGAVTVIACTLVGAIAGSGSSAIAAIGGLMIERMTDRGYDRGYAVSLVACSSVLAQLIPPSIPMIVFALMTGIPVTAAFLATLVPGILIALMYCLLNMRFAPAEPTPRVVGGRVAASLDTRTYLQKVSLTFRQAAWALFMPILMLGGIYSGLFTPTEAAAVAVGYVIIIGTVVYRGLTPASIGREIINAARISGAIIVILFALAIMSRAMLLEQIPGQISDILLGITDSPWATLLILNLVLLAIGMLIDDVSGSIVAAIVLWPIAQQLGLHPLHFAAIVGTNLGLGNVTPPCAPLLFMAGGIGKSQLSEYLVPTLKLTLLGHLPILMLVTFLPWVSLALPRWLLGIG